MIFTTMTDEVCESADLGRIFKTAAEYGITHFEIRGIGEKRFPDFDRATVEALRRAQREGVTFTAASPGIFKASLRSAEFALHRGERLTRTLALMEELGIGRLIIFGVERSPDDRPEDYGRVKEELARVAETAARSRVQVCVENEPGFWADTSENCRKLFDDIGSGNLFLNWDPGNLYNSGERDCAPGYALLRDKVRNLHVKDMRWVDGRSECVAVGEGEIDYARQLASLKADGYTGCVTVETHCRPIEENFRKSAAAVRRLLGEAGGRERG